MFKTNGKPPYIPSSAKQTTAKFSSYESSIKLIYRILQLKVKCNKLHT